MNYHYKIKLYESIVFDSASIEGFEGYKAIDLAKQGAHQKAIEKQIKYDRITVYTNDLELNKRIPENVSYYRRLYPDMSTCYKCGLPWGACISKPISCAPREGIFALCTYCWDNSTEDERLTFYKGLYYANKAQFGLTTEYGVQDVTDAVKRTK